MRPDDLPVANLFGGSLGFTLNKRQSIEREKSSHTPTRKKHGHTTCRASSVRARVAIQEALSVKMSSLHVNVSLSRRVELPDNCRRMIVTPDGDVDDEQRINDSADDSDYDDAPVANPTSKSLPSKIRNKKSEPKLTLDRNFMCFLRPHTFDHELFRRGKEDIYSITEIERFDSDYRRQLHFNFSATRITQKQKLAFNATRASRLRDVDLDALPDNTLSTISSSKRQDLSRYILEDILDCPVGSRFIVCIATEDNDDERSRYYSETARAIQSDFKSKGLPVETWKMSSKRYLVLQGSITRSSHYDDISMKSLTQRQFRDAFSNESGDVAIQFNGITTRLTVPWCNFINVSRCIMLFGFPFEHGRSFAKIFQKMKAQHAHHIFRQFASSTLAIHGLVRCSSSSISKQGWSRDIDVHTRQHIICLKSFSRLVIQNGESTAIPILVRLLL
jgi:hypothetical protein